MAPFAEQKIRFTYRKVESVQEISSISHPVLREVLNILKWEHPINIATFSDLPGNSGLGSSSSFTVGLLHALMKFDSREITPLELAQKSVTIERKRLNEIGGWQDQYHAAIGGFKNYSFENTSVKWSGEIATKSVKDFISDRQWIMPIGESRSSHKVQSSNQDETPDVRGLRNELAEISRHYSATISQITNEQQIYLNLVHGINQSWILKKRFQGVMNSPIENSINKLVSAGVDAVKLCGAGQGGFLLILGEKNIINDIMKLNPKLNIMNTRIYDQGSIAYSL